VWCTKVDDDTRQWWVGDRKDKRDSNFGAGGGGRSMNAMNAAQSSYGRDKGARGGGSWKRAPDDTQQIDGSMVLKLIEARDEARKSRDFGTADDIRLFPPSSLLPPSSFFSSLPLTSLFCHYRPTWCDAVCQEVPRDVEQGRVSWHDLDSGVMGLDSGLMRH